MKHRSRIYESAAFEILSCIFHWWYLSSLSIFLHLFFFFFCGRLFLFSDGFLSSSSVLSSSAGFAGLHFPFAMIMPVFT